jgi:hypothetical protein
MRESRKALTLHSSFTFPHPAREVRMLKRYGVGMPLLFCCQGSLKPQVAWDRGRARPARRVPDHQPPLDSIPVNGYYYLGFKSN